MKIETTKDKLSSALQKLQKVSAKQVSLPILESVLLEAKDNLLTLRTTNLHVGTELTLPVKMDEEGSVAVRYDLFTQIVSHLKSGDEVLHVETDGNVLVLRTSYSEMRVSTYNADEFPTLPKIENEKSFSLPISKLIEGMRSVLYAAAQTEMKPEISSVYLHVEGNELIFVSTDSFRLAEKRIVVEGIDDFPGVIIPIKNVQEFLRVFSGEDEVAEVRLSENQISFETDHIYFVSRIIDGNYPNYQQIIPKDEQTQAVVLKKELEDALKLVQVFLDEFNQMSLTTLPEKDQLEFRAKNQEFGEGEVSVDTHLSGRDVSLHFNYKYLADVLSHRDAQSVSFHFYDERRPFVVRFEGDPSFIYLIMPIHR